MFLTSSRTGSPSSIAVLAIMLFGAASTSLYAQTASATDSARTELQLKAGQDYSESLKLSVPSGPLNWHGEVRDFDDKATSCKNWLALEAADIKTDPNGLLNVRYTLHPPSGLTTGSYVCTVALTTGPSGAQKHLVEEIEITIGTPEIEGRLKQITVEAIPASSITDARWQAVVVIENKGEMYFRPTGTFDILDGRGNVLQTVGFPSLTILPERDQRFLFPVKITLAAGNYTFRARVSLGNGEIQQLLTDIVIDRPSRNVTQNQSDFPVPVSPGR